MDAEQKKGPSRSLMVLIVMIILFCIGVYHLPEGNTGKSPFKADDDEETLIPDTPLGAINAPLIRTAPQEEEPVPAAVIPEEAPVVDEPEATVPRVSAAAYKAVVSEGGALLTGGWENADGTRTFALVQPERVEGAENQCKISSRIFTIAPDKLNDPAWEDVLIPNERGLHLKGASYTRDELGAFNENYREEISQVLSSPQIVTLFGHAASIQISSEEKGLVVSVVAEEHADGIEVGVSVLDWEGGKLPGQE